MDQRKKKSEKRKPILFEDDDGRIVAVRSPNRRKVIGNEVFSQSVRKGNAKNTSVENRKENQRSSDVPFKRPRVQEIDSNDDQDQTESRKQQNRVPFNFMGTVLITMIVHKKSNMEVK